MQPDKKMTEAEIEAALGVMNGKLWPQLYWPDGRRRTPLERREAAKVVQFPGRIKRQPLERKEAVLAQARKGVEWLEHFIEEERS
jgi:hypothetical protein